MPTVRSPTSSPSDSIALGVLYHPGPKALDPGESAVPILDRQRAVGVHLRRQPIQTGCLLTADPILLAGRQLANRTLKGLLSVNGLGQPKLAAYPGKGSPSATQPQNLAIGRP
jgi:hypothetical protein